MDTRHRTKIELADLGDYMQNGVDDQCWSFQHWACGVDEMGRPSCLKEQMAQDGEVFESRAEDAGPSVDDQQTWSVDV